MLVTQQFRNGKTTFMFLTLKQLLKSHVIQTSALNHLPGRTDICNPDQPDEDIIAFLGDAEGADRGRKKRSAGIYRVSLGPEEEGG